MLIDKKLERNDAVKAAWITNEVCKTHKGIEGEDAGFYHFCAQHWVREQVNKALRHYNCKVETEADPQLVLPGYQYLQRSYLVTRDGEQFVVPIDVMTSAERRTKAAELRAMADGAKTHAEELERYDRNYAKIA